MTDSSDCQFPTVDGMTFMMGPTREELKEMGVLRDVSKEAVAAGIRGDIAISEGVWEDCLKGKDPESQTRDLLTILRRFWSGVTPTRGACAGDRIKYTVVLGGIVKNLVGVVEPGPGGRDHGILTIMLPHED